MIMNIFSHLQKLGSKLILFLSIHLIHPTCVQQNVIVIIIVFSKTIFQSFYLLNLPLFVFYLTLISYVALTCKLFFYRKFNNTFYQITVYSINFFIKNLTKIQMKAKKHILEKLLLVILYIQSVAYLDRQIMLGLSFFVFGLSFHFEGAKPYWPIFLLILILQFFQLSNFQMIVMVIGGFLLTVIKLYQIPIPGKGQFNSGYKTSKFQNVDFCIFYPTKQIGKKANWFPNKNYYKTLYEIFYVDPQTKRIPYFIFAFLVSFLTKVTMPVYLNTKICFDQNEKKKFKVIVFSHGLGANMNAYSSICGWFASHGYIVISIQHNHDKVCVDHRHLPLEDVWKIRDYLYQNRNRDLTIRVAQVRKVVRAIIESKFFKQHLGEQIYVQQLHLAGQSYGGGTILQTLADLIKQKKDHHIKSVIALDPWMFPLQKDAYETIKEKNILIINSQTFWESPSIPFIYQLQKRYADLKVSNLKTLKTILVTKMNHLDQCDMTFVFGNIMQFLRKNSHYYLSSEIMQLNLLIISLFLQEKSTKQIINIGNEFCEQMQLNKVGFQLMQQFRIERDMMLNFKQQRQKIVDKKMTTSQLIKRLFWP